MIKVFHNPRCAKSRQALKWLEEHEMDHQVYRYLDDGLRPDELETLLLKMECSAMDIIRTGEKIWKEEYAALDLNEDELVMVLSEAPILLERPIIVRGDLTFVARPTETMEQLL